MGINVSEQFVFTCSFHVQQSFVCSQTCFERPLNFTMEIGRISRVAAQSKVDLGQGQNRSIVITMLINRVNSRY